MQTWNRGWMMAACAAGLAVSAAQAAVKVDPALPDYAPVEGVSGTIKSVGSDTLNNLMTLWAEGLSGSIPTCRSKSRARGRPPRRPR